MKIGIVGTGNMGRSLGILLTELGHQVLFGARETKAAQEAADLAGSGAQFGTNDDAAAFGEVVFYGVRGVAPSQVLRDVSALDGKPIIDCNNRDIPEGFAFKSMEGPSLAETLASALPNAHVVKAFNTFAMEVFELCPTEVRQHGVSVYLCADSEAAKATVRGLVEQLGFVPIDCGPLRSARMVEAMGDFIRFLMMGMKRGSMASISVRDLPQPPAQRLGGRKVGA